MRTVTVVAAVARNGVIGREGDLPWHLPEDMRRFKELTMGGTLVMGRRTYESIGRPLPGRRTVVVTRQADWSAEGVETAGSLEEAIEKAGDGQVFVVGGAEVYRRALDVADAMVLTEVDAEPEGDVYFPDIPANWRMTRREPRDGFTLTHWQRLP